MLQIIIFQSIALIAIIFSTVLQGKKERKKKNMRQFVCKNWQELFLPQNVAIFLFLFKNLE